MSVLRAHQQKSAGFTLVEVLVSLFIFSILSAASLAILTSVMNSKDKMAEKSAALSQLATLRILLKADLGNTLNIPITDSFGQSQSAYFAGGSIGDDRILVLSRTAWDNPGGIERRSDLQSVAYALKDGELVRQTYARFNPVTNTPLIEQKLLGNITRIDLGFFDGEIWTAFWQTGEPLTAKTTLPQLARLDIHFKNGKVLRQIFRVGADQ